MKKSILYSILIILIVLGILLSYNFIKSKNNPQNHKIEFGIDIEDKREISLISYRKETRDKNSNLIEKEDTNIYTLKMDDNNIVICEKSDENCKTYEYIKINKEYTLQIDESTEENTFFVTMFDGYDEKKGSVLEYVKQLDSEGNYLTLYFEKK